MLPYNNIPDWLRQSKDNKEYPIYCTHHNKVPTNGTHVDDMSTYHTFSEAISLMANDEGLGIGLFGNLCGIDIDHAVNPDGSISQTAQDIINYFDGAYMEYSFSHTGIHIFFFCKEQHKYQKYYTKMGEKQLQAKGITDIGGLELYQGRIDNRYLTLTGNIITQKNPQNYTVTPKKIESFLDKYFLRPPVSTTTTPAFTSSDAEDIAWFSWARQRKPERLFQMASKTPTGSGGTESEDDLAFMTEIAFWTNNNPVLMRKVFEASQYYLKKDAYHKRKWARPDYSNGVIAKATPKNVAKVFFSDYHYNGKEIVRNDD